MNLLQTSQIASSLTQGNTKKLAEATVDALSVTEIMHVVLGNENVR